MPNIQDRNETINVRLGSDLKFPINGNTETINGLDILLQDIQQLLLTVPGERVFRPNYGCTLRTFIWENIETVETEGANSIRRSLNEFEPRIDVINVTSESNENSGLVTFDILFSVKETDSVVNLVFPFRIGTQLSFA
jgi:phage baseplate assembly protein W